MSNSRLQARPWYIGGPFVSSFGGEFLFIPYRSISLFLSILSFTYVLTARLSFFLVERTILTSDLSIHLSTIDVCREGRRVKTKTSLANHSLVQCQRRSPASSLQPPAASPPARQPWSSPRGISTSTCLSVADRYRCGNL